MKCAYAGLFKIGRSRINPSPAGYGSDKYVEVNRLAAGAAFESGGCIVARWGDQRSTLDNDSVSRAAYFEKQTDAIVKGQQN